MFLIALKPSALLKKNIKSQASSTVALGRTLIASQILAANEKGNTKLTVKVLGSSSLGAIITVADTKGNVKGYVQNPGVDIQKDRNW